MAVQVQGPSRQRRDLFDVLIGGLQAASAFTNIQKAQAELESIPEVRARQQRQERQQFALNFQEVPQGTPGAQELESPDGETGLYAPRAILQAQKEATTKTGERLTDQETKLRDKWLSNPQTKISQEVAVAAGKVRAIGNDPKPSAAGDLSMIFNYMKLLDPGSVVREGEFATAQNATGVPQRVQNLYNNLLRGERLNPNQRQDFVSRAEQLYNVHWERQKAFNDAFEELAIKSGLDPKNIILDLKFEPIKPKGLMPNDRALEDIKNLNLNLQRIQRGPQSTQPAPASDFDIDEFLAE